MYERCAAHNIPYRKLGKLVVALEHQVPYIKDLHHKAENLPRPPHSPASNNNNSSSISSISPVIPTHLISGDEARKLEPHLSPNIVAALFSPETGIIDSHSFMQSLEKDIQESEGGELAYSTQVVRVDPHLGSQQAHGNPSMDNNPDSGWVVQIITGSTEESDSVLARTLINASGLAGNLILNSLLPEDRRIPMYYAKGSYASYNGPGVSGIQHLLYPCPGTGRTTNVPPADTNTAGSQSAHGFQSLGTHLTLDLDGKVKFGPDLEWLNPPDESDSDFWQDHLAPNGTRLRLMHEAITQYLPDVTLEGLQPDYSGIRPKLVGPNGGFQDFVIRKDYPESFGTSQRGGRSRRCRGSPMISLLGIESPGLTSSLALAELVVEDILCAEEGHVDDTR